MKQKLYVKILLHTFFIIASITFIVPFLLMVSISVSNETDVIEYGFKLIPMHIDFTAYKLLFQDFGPMAWASVFTIFVSCVSAFGSNILCALMAYPLSRSDFSWKGVINKILLFTMLFNAGLIPKYILNTQYLHLNNTVWIYLIPGVSAWSVILYRTFFSQISPSLIESAKIDGASNTVILKSIMIPLTKSMIMIQVFQAVVTGWNGWETSLYYITNKKLYTIQYLMQVYLKNAQELRKVFMENPAFQGQLENIPVETVRYAMAVIATIPVLLIFPFLQKYFSKGIAVGSVKG